MLSPTSKTPVFDINSLFNDASGKRREYLRGQVPFHSPNDFWNNYHDNKKYSN